MRKRAHDRKRIEKLVELATGADLLIHDAQYTTEEYYGVNRDPRRTWGHSTPEAAAQVALSANIKKLVLFHHDPYHNDAAVDQMCLIAAATFPETIAASEGMVIKLNSAAIPSVINT